MEKYYFFLKVLVKSQQIVHKQYVHFASIKITKYKRADPFTQNEPAPFTTPEDAIRCTTA